MITKNEIQKALAMNIGKSLADVRKRIGWTQGELAERIGVETETISRFERGATTPSLLTLQRLKYFRGQTPIFIASNSGGSRVRQFEPKNGHLDRKSVV